MKYILNEKFTLAEKYILNEKFSLVEDLQEKDFNNAKEIIKSYASVDDITSVLGGTAIHTVLNKVKKVLKFRDRAY